MSAQIKYRILEEHQKAFRIFQAKNEEGAGIGIWIPRSLCSLISKGPVQADGSRDATITLAEWFATKNNLTVED